MSLWKSHTTQAQRTSSDKAARGRAGRKHGESGTQPAAGGEITAGDFKEPQKSGSRASFLEPGGSAGEVSVLSAGQLS